MRRKRTITPVCVPGGGTSRTPSPTGALPLAGCASDSGSSGTPSPTGALPWVGRITAGGASPSPTKTDRPVCESRRGTSRTPSPATGRRKPAGDFPRRAVRLSKNLRYGGWIEQRGSSRGQGPLRISGFFGNSILPQAKCSAAEAQSKKSGMDFFDKQKARRGFPRRAVVLRMRQRCVVQTLRGSGRPLLTARPSWRGSRPPSDRCRRRRRRRR